jgi:uncharacterized protein (DUF58 family)
VLAFLARPRARLRTRLKFTREGRYFVGISLGVGFAAVNTGNNLLYLLLGMMLSMIVVSGILSEQTLRGLKAERELPLEVYAGRAFLTGITLVNRKERLPSFSVQVEDVLAGAEGGPPPKKCYFLKVPPGARQQTGYRTELPRRGLWRFEGFRLRTRYPFGFFLKTRQVEAPAELVVYPRLVPVGELPDAARAFVGTVEMPRRGPGREFHGLRPYREGDDARDIHWKRSAREGRLVLREYEAEGSPRVAVALPLRVPEAPTGEFGDALERSVDLAASLVAHFARRGHEVELLLPGQRIPVGDDGRGLETALRALALVAFQVGGEAAPIPDRGRVLVVTHPRCRPLLPRLPAGAQVLEVA